MLKSSAPTAFKLAVTKSLAILLTCSFVFSMVASFDVEKAIAQSQEAGINEHVADTTYLVMSFNMESMLELAGDLKLLKDHKDQEDLSSVDFANILRYQTMLAVKGEDEEEIPYVSTTLFRKGFVKEDYLKSQQDGMFFMETEFKEEQLEEATVHRMQSTDGDMHFGGTLPLVLFGEEGVVSSGNKAMLTKMLTSNADSSGRGLVGSVDADAQFHLILEDGSHLITEEDFLQMTSMMMGDSDIDIEDLLGNCERLDAILNLNAMGSPAKIVLKMNSDEAAEDAEKMLKAFLESVPKLMDQADETMNSIPDELSDFEETFRSLIELGRMAAEKAEINRTGAQLEVSLDHFEEMDGFPKMMCSVFLAFTLQREVQKERFKR